jgi:hypothetical protein
MAITKYYKIVQPSHDIVARADNASMSGMLYGNYTWYHRLVHGSSSRIVKYKEYDLMDEDIDVARSLDIIAEEMTGNSPKTKEPLLIKLNDEYGQTIQSNTVITLKAALATWSRIQAWKTRLFTIARQTIKYGDCFFIRPENTNEKIIYVHPKNVLSAVVSENDISDIRGWYIRDRYMQQTSTNQPYNSMANGSDIASADVIAYLEDDIIRFSLNDEMSDEAPFGISILRPVYKTFKQKELLEDAILIYRIQRAPEKRVYYVDVGKTPPNMVSAVLQNIKNELKQKKIPTYYGGKSTIDSIYNPESMSEDIFLPQRSDGSGSKVETLPGGAGLGELADLEYFYKKMWRAMRIPNSYMSNMTEDGSVDNNGRVGIAYMQEIKFSLYIQRLQKSIEVTMDKEFKRYLHTIGIKIDPTMYDVVLPEPSDYSKSKESSTNQENVGIYTSVDGIESLSKRFSMKKYLQLTPDEIKENERLKAEELGLDMDNDKNNLAKIYNPKEAELGGFEGGLGGSPSFGGGMSGGGEGLPSEENEGGENTEGEQNPENSPTQKGMNGNSIQQSPETPPL